MPIFTKIRAPKKGEADSTQTAKKVGGRQSSTSSRWHPWIRRPASAGADSSKGSLDKGRKKGESFSAYMQRLLVSKYGSMKKAREASRKGNEEAGEMIEALDEAKQGDSPNRVGPHGGF